MLTSRFRCLEKESYPIFFPSSSTYSSSCSSEQLSAEQSPTSHAVRTLVHVVEAHVCPVTTSDVCLEQVTLRVSLATRTTVVRTLPC